MKQEWLICAALTIGITLVMMMRFYVIDHTQTMEWGYVNAGAINPYYGTNPPLGYRPLMPALLNFIGTIPKAGEPMIPIAAAVVMCMVFYAFLRVYGIPVIESVMGTVFLVCSPGIADLLKEFCINHVDSASHILILVALIAIIKKNHALFSLATIIGTFNREWALTLIPAWYIYHYGFHINKQSLFLAARVTLPSLCVYWMVRDVYFPNTALGVMAQDTGTLAGETGSLRFYLNEFLSTGIRVWQDRVFSGDFYQYGMIALLPVMAGVWKKIDKRWLYLSLYYMLICILQLAIAADVWRLSFYLFPIILTLFAHFLVQLNSNRYIQYIIFGVIVVTNIIYPSSIILLLITTVTVAGQGNRTKLS